MLDTGELKRQIKSGFSNTITPALEEAIKTAFPAESEIGNDVAKSVSEVFDDLAADAFAEVLAYAIDYYVKNISITGKLITTGPPAPHYVQINSLPVPSSNGKIPNTLGVK